MVTSDALFLVNGLNKLPSDQTKRPKCDSLMKKTDVEMAVILNEKNPL